MNHVYYPRPFFLSRFLLGAIALLLLALPSLARAATWTVALDGSGQYTTIQAAITAASNGDTVLVAAGTYSGLGNRDIDFGGKNLTVTSQAGAASTIIDCGGYASIDGSGNHRGFYIHSGETNAVVNGFTVKNGYENGGNGGGICINGSSVVVQFCIIDRNTAYSGGGVYDFNYAAGTASLTHCTITANNAQFGGGGIYGYDNITISDCIINNNNVYLTTNDCSGGGLYIIGSSPTLTNCTIAGNSSQDTGGGISIVLDDGIPTLINCTVTGNVASNGSGVFLNDDNGPIILTNNIVYGDIGDEIKIEGGITTVSNCDIQGGYSGTGNIDKDPRFVNAAYGDLHLKPGSPCIGAGTAIGAPTTDLDGNLRANPPSMGAYEGAGNGVVLQRPVGSLTLYDGGYYAAHTDLSDSAASSVNIPRLTSDTQICYSAVADGATKILLRYNASTAGTVAFTETNGVSGDNLRPVYGTNILNLPVNVSTQVINGQNVAFAVYTVPETLAPTILSQSVKFQAVFTPSGGAAGPAATNSLLLQRTPVILIHGFASSPGTWSQINGAWASLEQAGFDTYRVDYHTTSNASLSTNAQVLYNNPGGINDVCTLYRSRGIAITKVDVVGHSMGGLITRKFAASSAYRSVKNFQQGYVRRFITLGTPHDGSPFATDIATLAQNIPGVKGLLSHTPFYYGDAYIDLRPGSLALHSLGATAIPCYAEVGDYFGLPTNLFTEVSNILKFFSYYGTSYDDIFNGEANDFVVGETSAEGGLPAIDYDIYSSTNHLQETTSDNIGADVVRLLSGPLTNFDTDGFPASQTFAPNARITQPRDIQEIAPFVMITAPTAGQTFAPGDTLTVTVTPNAGTTLTQVLMNTGTNQQPVGSALVTAAPYTATFTIPNSYLGDLPITVLAQDSNGNVCSVIADAVVQTTATVTSLAVSASKVAPSGAALLTSQGSTDPLTVTGTFSDGGQRDITLGILGTQYVSSDPTIATVSADGLITAIANGTVTITVTNGTASASENVMVQLGTPNILSTTPSSAAPGATVSLALTGTDFGGASQVQFLTNGNPDPSITVTNIQTDIPGTSLTATVTLKAGAAFGLHTVVVTTTGGSSDPLAAPDAAGFTVTSPWGAHVLWTNTSGQVSIWNYNTTSGGYSHLEYGPFASWTAKAIADGGTDGKTRVLWTSTSNQMSLWSLDNTTGVCSHAEYGPYPGWTANAVSVAPDNTTHVFWTNTNGQVSIWNYDTASGAYNHVEYGPFAGWTAKTVADGPDGKMRVLWNNTNGALSLWSLDNAIGVYSHTEYGPYADWTANTISVGNDNTTHIGWTNTPGMLSLWNDDTMSGGYNYINYGPFSGWSAQAIADGSDGKTQVMWDKADGTMSFWGLNNTTGVYSHAEYGPYPGWTAVGVSAP